MRYRSRLSKMSLFERHQAVSALLPSYELPAEATYFDTKRMHSAAWYQECKEAVRGKGAPLEGWLVSGEEFESFTVEGRQVP